MVPDVEFEKVDVEGYYGHNVVKPAPWDDKVAAYLFLGGVVRIFRTIPGLENAEFARLGGLHRNTFLNSPTLLDRQLRLRSAPHIRFAGQITGCEGYVESASVGLLAGLMAAAEIKGRAWAPPPRTSALGALLAHITGDAEAESFQPMNVNFGLFPPLTEVKKKQRKEAYTERAKADLAEWLPQVA